MATTALLNVGITAPSLIALPWLRLLKVNSSNHRRPTFVQCSGSKIRANLSMHAYQKSLSMSQRAAASLAGRAALSAVYAAEGQTQTIERQSTKIRTAPVDVKKKSPELGIGGTGFPPRDDDGKGNGGGGGWGGGGDWRGWFFLFLLVIIDILQRRGNDKAYGSIRRRK